MSKRTPARPANSEQRNLLLRALRFLWPRSFLGLVLLGFSLVTLPLFLALYHATSYVDRLERQGTGALYRAVAATQGSRTVLEHVNLLERKARQYSVLGDEPSRAAYEEEDKKARSALNELWRSSLSDEQRDELLSLASGLRTLAEAVGSSPADVRQAAGEFEHLNRLARSILAQSNDLVLAEAAALEAITLSAKRSLAWQAAAGVPAALIVAVLFSLLISRPVRQIDKAIRRLGGGDFTSEIAVSGPEDLAALGRTMDWLRRRLSELQGEKARFLARASHDLKTPLTAIREGAELLLEEAVGPLGPEQQEIGKILRDNSLRLQRSIQGLLDYSVSEARGESSPERRQPVPLQGLVKEVLADNGPAAARKELTLTVSGEDLWVLGDREQLRVALDNLVSNSVKFTPAGGTLSVSVSSVGGAAAVDLRDTGPGIAPEERERVFEDFYQGTTTSDGPIRGSGLGLSIAREQVERHGGTLVILDAPGGAHLRVTLPMERKEKRS